MLTMGDKQLLRECQDRRKNACTGCGFKNCGDRPVSITISLKICEGTICKNEIAVDTPQSTINTKYKIDINKKLCHSCVALLKNKESFDKFVEENLPI